MQSERALYKENLASGLKHSRERTIKIKENCIIRGVYALRVVGYISINHPLFLHPQPTVNTCLFVDGTQNYQYPPLMHCAGCMKGGWQVALLDASVFVMMWHTNAFIPTKQTLRP